MRKTFVLAVALLLKTAQLTGQTASAAVNADQVASGGSSTPSTYLSKSTENCRYITTAKDAARCIGSLRPSQPVSALDREHVYTLPELIDIAESASPEARIAWAAAKMSLEQAGVDQALYLPLITFLARGGDSRSIVPFPKPLAPYGFVVVDQPIAAAQLQLDYSLLDFGRRAKVDGSRALELASTLRLSRTHQKIAYSTSAEFYKTQEAAGHLDAARMILETAQTLLLNSQAQFDNGRATLPDVQNAQAGVAEAQFDLASAMGELKKAKLALTEVLGVEPTTGINIQPQQNTSSEPLDRSVEELVRTARRSRPDLLARMQEVRHANAVAAIAHSAYLPTVAVNVSGGQTATWPTANYGQLGPANISTWSGEVALRWELFNGARRHEVAAAAAGQRSALEEQRAAQDAVSRQVWDAYVDYQTAMEQQRSSQSFLAAAQTSYDSSLDAYKYGVRSLVDVVQAERQLAQARVAAVRSQAQLMQSATALSYATGDLPRNNAAAPGARP